MYVYMYVCMYLLCIHYRIILCTTYLYEMYVCIVLTCLNLINLESIKYFVNLLLLVVDSFNK